MTTLWIVSPNVRLKNHTKIAALSASLALLIVGAFPDLQACAGGNRAAAPRRVFALAKSYFYQFRSGRVDRALFDSAVNLELTNEMVAGQAEMLRPFGKPEKFVYLGSEKVQYATGYNFQIRFRKGRVLEQIAFDYDGKIAGIKFETFGSR